MFQIIKKQVRADTSVNFYSPRDSLTMPGPLKQLFFDKYIATGKQLEVVYTVSEDGLTQTTTALWESEEAANEFINDPDMVEFIQDWTLHCQHYGVTGSLVSKTNI
jgi:hypothetical protein